MTDVIPLIPEAPATFADDAADIGALAAQGETPPNERNRKSVSQKKLEKRIVRLTGQAVTDFDMIREGDKIMVAMSGGKDSYVLLDTLKTLQHVRQYTLIFWPSMCISTSRNSHLKP